MSTLKEREEDKEAGQRKRDSLYALIRAQIMDVVGQPVELLAVQVRRLWSRYYRVNVFTGPDIASARIAHSYFVEVDDDARVVKSTPAITRQY